MKTLDKIILDFRDERKKEQHDIEVSSDITARELILGLIEAYGLDIDTSYPDNIFLRANNPTVLLKGDKKLYEYGLHKGSIVYYL